MQDIKLFLQRKNRFLNNDNNNNNHILIIFGSFQDNFGSTNINKNSFFQIMNHVYKFFSNDYSQYNSFVYHHNDLTLTIINNKKYFKQHVFIDDFFDEDCVLLHVNNKSISHDQFPLLKFYNDIEHNFIKKYNLKNNNNIQFVQDTYDKNNTIYNIIIEVNFFNQEIFNLIKKIKMSI